MPSSLEPAQEEMQKDTSLPSPSGPLATTTMASSGRQAGASGSTSRSEPGHPKTCRKPVLSKVILRILEDKGVHNRISLATLKKAVAITGYNMTRNAWRFKLVLKRLVEKGLLKQVTGKGSSGSFCVGKKYASKSKLVAKKRQGPPRKSAKQPRQRQSRQAKLQVGSKQGQKRVAKGARRAARRRCGH